MRRGPKPWCRSKARSAVAGFERVADVHGLAAEVLLDTCVESPEGAFAGCARRPRSGDGCARRRSSARPRAGRVLDPTVLRSYCIGAVHMALGWVLSEGIAVVIPDTGVVHDLTIRSFGILRARDMPPVDVVIVDDEREPIEWFRCRVRGGGGRMFWNALA